MAQVTGKTAAYMDAVVAATVQSGYVRSDNHLILVLHDSSEIDAGLITADAATLVAAQAYADQAELDAIASAETYADQAEADAKSYSDVIGNALTARLNGTSIPTGANLNTYLTSGYYYQSSDAFAAAGSNYPVAKAGALEVLYNGSDKVVQRYTPFSNVSSVVYMRQNNAGVWKPWVVFRAKRNRQNMLASLTTFSTGTIVNESGARGSNPTVWSMWSVVGSATASIQSDATAGTTGFGRFLALYSPAGTNHARVDSPVMDVVPGGHYVVRWKQGAIHTTGTPRQYFRIAGGSDASMTEYPGSSSSSGLQPIGYYENVSMPDIGDTYGNANASLMVERSLSFKVPAGITKAAIAIVQYQPTGSITAIYKDFEFYRIDGDEAPSDTGWISLCSQGGWDSEEALVRIKDDIFYATGRLVPVSGYTTGWTSPAALLPPFVSEAMSQAETTRANQGLRGWLTSTGGRVARLSMYASDHSSAAGYVNVEPSATGATYFELVQMAIPLGVGS